MAEKSPDRPKEPTGTKEELTVKRVVPEAETPAEDSVETPEEETEEPIVINSNSLSAIKKWQVGKKYDVKLQLKKLEHDPDDDKNVIGTFVIS